MDLLANSLLLAVLVVAGSLLVGVPFALVAVGTDVRGRRLLPVLVAGMLFVPAPLHAGAWQAVWGSQGWLAAWFGWPALEGWPAVVWIHISLSVPWVMAMVGVGLMAVEPELHADARLDTGTFGVLLRVTLRRLLAPIVAAALWVAGQTLGEIGATNLYQIPTLAEQVYNEFAGNEIDQYRAARVVPMLLVVSLVIGGVLATLARRVPADGQVSPGRFEPLAWGKHRERVSLALLQMTLALGGVPLIALFAKVGVVVTRTSNGWQRGWSMAHAVGLLLEVPARYSRELLASISIGMGAATVVLPIALGLAWQARRGRIWPWWGVALALALPSPILGVLLVELFNLGTARWLAFLYDRTLLAPILAQAVRALPVATLMAWYAFRTVPRELIELAACDGANPFRLAIRLRLAACGVAWLAALLVAMGDLAATILVIPPGVTTLTIRTFGLLHYGMDDQVAALTLFQIFGFVLASSLVRLIK